MNRRGTRSTPRHACSLAMFAVLVPAAATARAQSPITTPAPSTEQGGRIHGTVKAGPIPLPGVSITATNTLTGKRYATSTDVTGAYSMAIPGNGRYVVKAELAAFASATAEALVNAAGASGGKPDQQAEFSLQLASRVAAAQAATTTATSALTRGLQSLSVSGEAGLADASAGAGNAGAQLPSISGLDSGGGATESVTVSGQIGQTNGLANFSEDDIRQRVQDALQQAQRQGGAAGDMANAVVGMIGNLIGGPGGGGFGGGGFGGGGGRGGGGGFRNFNPTQPHGAVFYQGGNGALNATAYSLTGAPVVKPAYSNNRFGLSFTGSPSIPGLLKANSKQFVFFNLTGQRNINPQNFYGTVPTLAERAGDFSQPIQTANGSTAVPAIYDPATHQPFADNIIPAARLSAQALALLNFYPAPNLPITGAQGYNYQTITTAGQNATQAALRYVRNFGQQPSFGGGGAGGGGRRQQQAANAPKSLRQNINFNGSYSHNASDLRNLFLPLGGTTASDGYGVTAGYSIGYGRLNNNASVNWNRSHAMTRNYLTNGAVNPAVQDGIVVGNSIVQGNPFNYGVPSLQFSGFTGLGETSPSDTINQTLSLSDFVSWNHKKHNLRFGADLRRIHADSIGSSNVLGAFTFTGYATQGPQAAPGAAQQTIGPGFADFLLGLPQQASVQAGLQKTYLRANVFDWFAQDDWRVLPSVTLNLGLRYEYFSPYVEKNNRLVNLDHNADFTQVAAVQAAQTGAFTGAFPRSLVNPDRNLYSPRFGFAYRVKHLKQTVLRGGYGINFNTTQYAGLARQLAFQPPFAITQTNIVNQQGCGILTLANAFNCSTAPVQNNYAVNPSYRLGHVQVWNLDLQRTFPLGIVANVGFNGAKGGSLDIVRAPNRTATGLLDASAQPFNYEDSLGYSRFESLTVNVRKRLQKGIALQATYQYGHSIDNASSIGGTATVVAQNDRDLNAEEGNSAFDVRHKVTGNWVFELPFGPNRPFLAKGGTWSKALDGFSISGDYTFASGTYYTPHYVATVAETNTGSNNSLRPNRNFAVPIAGAGRITQWFNPAAFTAPATGAFGTASRGSIEGPGVVGIDASLSRTVRLGETRSFEARVTANNVFNTVQYSGINTTLNSPTFGQITSTATQRNLTVLARYRF